MKFIDWLEMAAVQYAEMLPACVEQNLVDLYIRLKDHRDGKRTMDPKIKSQCEVYARELKALKNMPIFAYNGERYDIPVLKGALFDELFRRDAHFSVIKRGCGVMQMSCNTLLFKDAGMVVYNPLQLWYISTILKSYKSVSIT